VIEIAAVAGVATVQDGGRPGHMHEGVPPGGALVPELLARANAAARNAPTEAAIEAVGRLRIVARGAIRVGADDGTARSLRDGDAWTLEPGPTRVRYLAVRGGIDVPRVLGGRGTLLVAGLGGYEGRPLRRGDRLPIGSAEPCDTPAPAPPRLEAPIRVVPGPDLDRFDPAALQALLDGGFTVDARSDRVGIRLIGSPLACIGEETGWSVPMVRGAIQVPPDGQPIVLGPDHPTTGGYPVLATVVRADVGALAARPVGAMIRFVGLGRGA
jgi:biotin-dependent carboxylase-like uncharacterized protein